MQCQVHDVLDSVLHYATSVTCILCCYRSHNRQCTQHLYLLVCLSAMMPRVNSLLDIIALLCKPPENHSCICAQRDVSLGQHTCPHVRYVQLMHHQPCSTVAVLHLPVTLVLNSVRCAACVCAVAEQELFQKFSK